MATTARKPSAEPPTSTHGHLLRRLFVLGGFLDRVNIEFAPGLNCIIGGRGPGVGAFARHPQELRSAAQVADGQGGNWLFAGSDNGGRTAAVLYSAIASARRHGPDPQAYLCGVLAQIPVLPHSKLDELLPDHWKAALERERREAEQRGRCASPSGEQPGDGTVNSTPA